MSLCARGQDIQENWTFRKILTEFKAADGPNRWVRTWGSMWRYPREFWGLTIRLLPTTGVCHQPMGHKLHDKKIISSSFFDCRQSILGQRSKIQLYLREIWARFSLWSKMVWAKGSKGRGAANLAKGYARSGVGWLTPAGTKPVRLARGCLLPCLDLKLLP